MALTPTPFKMPGNHREVIQECACFIFITKYKFPYHNKSQLSTVLGKIIDETFPLTPDIFQNARKSSRSDPIILLSHLH
jgi:hypothetical protein